MWTCSSRPAWVECLPSGEKSGQDGRGGGGLRSYCNEHGIHKPARTTEREERPGPALWRSVVSGCEPFSISSTQGWLLMNSMLATSTSSARYCMGPTQYDGANKQKGTALHEHNTAPAATAEAFLKPILTSTQRTRSCSITKMCMLNKDCSFSLA